MLKRIFAILLALSVLFSFSLSLADDFDDDDFDEDFGDDSFEEEESEVDFKTIAGFAEAEQTIVSGDFVYLLNPEDDTASICGYSGISMDVVVPETLDDHEVVAIDNQAFNFLNIETVTLPSTVKSIGIMAFYKCPMLTKVTISDGLVSIGDCCFGADESLEEIIIPDTLETVGTAAFAACTNLKEISFGTALQFIGPTAFYGCLDLRTVTLPDGVELDDTVFTDCSDELQVIRK